MGGSDRRAGGARPLTRDRDAELDAGGRRICLGYETAAGQPIAERANGSGGGWRCAGIGGPVGTGRRSVEPYRQPSALACERGNADGNNVVEPGCQGGLCHPTGDGAAGFVSGRVVLLTLRIGQMARADHTGGLKAHPRDGDASEDALQRERVHQEHAKGGPPCSCPLDAAFHRKVPSPPSEGLSMAKLFHARMVTATCGSSGGPDGVWGPPSGRLSCFRSVF